MTIITTISSLSWWFVKSHPPRPCASAVEKLGLKESLGVVFRNRGLLLVFVIVSWVWNRG